MTHFSLPGTALAAFLALLAGALPSPSRAAEEGSPEAYLAPSPESLRGRSMLLAGGLAFPIMGSQGVQPEGAVYADLPHALQLGVRLRSDVSMAQDVYDYIPQAALHLRRLWISDQDTSTIRNSEYISLALGAYTSYDLKGERTGLKPFFTVQTGKYWMPFDNQPIGLDFTLEFTRYIDGLPPGKEQPSFLSTSVNLFKTFKI